MCAVPFLLHGLLTRMNFDLRKTISSLLSTSLVLPDMLFSHHPSSLVHLLAPLPGIPPPFFLIVTEMFFVSSVRSLSRLLKYSCCAWFPFPPHLCRDSLPTTLEGLGFYRNVFFLFYLAKQLDFTSTGLQCLLSEAFVEFRPSIDLSISSVLFNVCCSTSPFFPR